MLLNARQTGSSLICRRKLSRRVLIVFTSVMGIMWMIMASLHSRQDQSVHSLQQANIFRMSLMISDRSSSSNVTFSKSSTQRIISLNPSNSSHLKTWRDIFPESVFRHHMLLLNAEKMAYLQARKHRVELRCSQGWHPRDPSIFGEQKLLLFDLKRDLGYCRTPKVGSTFWGRVFTFITRPGEMKTQGIDDPFEIGKMLIHNGMQAPLKWAPWSQFESSVYRPNRTLKFMFARNPYSRLWSVYLDKFYLLGEWEGQGRSDRWCADYDSFQSFLEQAVESSDQHVMPISELCDPCQFRPDVVGHMETFGTDTQFILNQTRYLELLKPRTYTHQFQVDVEIKSAVTNNYYILRGVESEQRTCVDEKSLCQRLWHVFQMNAYISSSVEFPTNITDYSQSAIMPVFLDAARISALTSSQSRFQKHANLVNAYSSIPLQLIQRIQEKYRNDFELFDYDINPPS